MLFKLCGGGEGNKPSHPHAVHQRPQRVVAAQRQQAGDGQRSHFRARDLHAAAVVQHRARRREIAERGIREQERQHAERTDGHGAPRNQQDVFQRVVEIRPRELDERRNRRVVALEVRVVEERPVPAPVLALSLMARYQSRLPDGFGNKVIAALRNEFGGHAVKAEGTTGTPASH